MGGDAGMAGAPSVAALIVRAGNRRCALRAAHVIETLRPLPVEPVAGLPAYVLGLAVVRGAAVPVLDLAGLLREDARGPATRFVSVRAGSRRAALAVEEVLALHTLDAAALEAMPLPGAALEAVAVLDARLLPFLETARLVPDEAWEALEVRKA